MAAKPAPPPSAVSTWLRFAAEIGALLVAISLAYAGLDKRLAVIELKMSAGLEAQKEFASKAALEGLEARIQNLETQEHMKETR